jgi:general secretion pathway protein B
MSYILDALRKSDQQRQRGATPSLMTVPATVAAPKQPRFLLNSVLAAVLICAGMVVGWLRPWQTAQPLPAAEPGATQPIAAGPGLTEPWPPAVLPEMPGQLGQEEPPQPSASAAAQAAFPSADVPAFAGKEPPPAQSQAVAAVPREAVMPLPDKLAPVAPASAGQGQGVMALGDLPVSIRKEIPDLSISMHVYASDPGERHVMINGEMLGQGESLAPGLRLEQITPDGVILGYKGYRFHRGVR